MLEEKSKRHLVFYGKGGIGKTTVAINLAYAIAGLGEKVLIIGCSPKSSLWDFCGFPDKATILDLERSASPESRSLKECIVTTEEGIVFIESGGPEPGVGCGGRGLQVALGRLKDLDKHIPDFNDVRYFMYDVIGDVVCGGFAMPMRGRGAREVFVVTSGELLSLYAANNVVASVAKLSESPLADVSVAGYVANLRGVPNEREILTRFSEITNVPILAYIPRDVETFFEAEKCKSAVVRLFPGSEPAEIFRRMALSIAEPSPRGKARPIVRYEELFDLFMQYQKALPPIHVKKEPSHSLERFGKGRPAVRDKVKRIAIYGTGGIGKSTTSSNVSAALARLGERVFQIGCDPKRDSISTICGGLKPAILDEIRTQGRNNFTARMLKDLIFSAPGFDGCLFGCECGGPAPGKGCAGYGVDIALEYLEQFGIVDEYKFSFVVYDVLGDTVCGGFATPLRYVSQVYIVTSGEIPALVQAMKICQSVDVVRRQGLKVDSMSGVINYRGAVEVGIAGIINNKRGMPGEEGLVEEVFASLGIPVINHIPRSDLIQASENLSMTCVQAFPDSGQAGEYMKLAKQMQENEKTFPLKRMPLTKSEIIAIGDKCR